MYVLETLFADFLKEKLVDKSYVLADGALGTYFSKLYGTGVDKCELSNIDAPENIKRIHRDYIEAGAQIIRTNTFAANTVSLKASLCTVTKIIRAGFRLASDVANGNNVYVFADIGPIPDTENHDSLSEYKAIVDTFFEAGAKNFIFETFGSFDILLEVCRYIKSRDRNAFVLAQFAISPDGLTRKGVSGKRIIDVVGSSDVVDALGFNCASGPVHLLEYIKNLEAEKRSLISSIMPNAGYPSVQNERTIYQDNPEYFAGIMSDIKNLGIKILGGCCGTTPRHIAETRRILENVKKEFVYQVSNKKQEKQQQFPMNIFREKLENGEMPVAVEFDPPASINISDLIEGAKSLKDCGADIITVADNPFAKARIDSSIYASKIKREAGIDTLPHLTCRDKNLNAIKALLLGLHIEGIRNILAVTGDPIPDAEKSHIKGVFNFNSYMLINFIRELNCSEFSGDEIFIGAALNVNAENFDAELKRAEIKIRQGARFFLTQPVFSPKAVEALRKAKESLNAKILGGILPIVSSRNARFLSNEIPGISIPEHIIVQFEGKGRDDAEKTGIKIAVETWRDMMPYCDGAYLITPFNRWKMICEIISRIKHLS